MLLWKEFECPTKTNSKCEVFWQTLLQYPGHNLRKGLKCLGYDKNINAMQSFRNGSEPQRIDLDITRVNIVQINEEKQYSVWEYKSKMSWYDYRLKWPKECQLNLSQNMNIIRSDILKYIWNPIAVFQEIANVAEPVYEKTMAIGEVRIALSAAIKLLGTKV